MKKRLALLTVVAAGAVAYSALKNKKKVFKVEENEKETVIETTSVQLPKLPKKTKLSDTLVESYRVQCQVMMDGYPEEMKIDLVHHIELTDSAKTLDLADKLRAAGYDVEDQLESLSLKVIECINTSAQEAFDAVIKLAEIAHTEKADYQGWILENCR